MSAEKLLTPPFPPLRRVITGHTIEGKSVVVEDSPVLPHTLGGATNETYFTDIFWTDEFPSESTVEFKDLAKGHRRTSSVRMGVASVFWSFLPVVHRLTITLDYGIVLSGSLTLILDDDKRAVLNAGDVIVQRDTIHGWVNEGTEWARVFFVLLPAKNVQIGDKVLGPDFRILP